MEFWSNNSCVLSWSSYLSQWWQSKKVGVLENTPMPRKVSFPAGCAIVSGKQEHTPIIKEFWYRYFSISSKCKCLIPEDFLKRMITSLSWELWLVINSRGEIIGTVVRKRLGEIQIGDQSMKEAYMVDYFCVHPAWRKKGIGRGLLNHLHNQTKHPFSPHFILWEGVQASIPPISSGIYWWREGKGININTQIKKQILENKPLTPTKNDIFSRTFSKEETSIWQMSKGVVYIWNTFHRTMPEGKELYILLHGTSEEAIEEYMNTLETDKIILRPRGITEAILPGWNYDSPYQWVVYNLRYTGGYSYPVFMS